MAPTISYASPGLAQTDELISLRRGFLWSGLAIVPALVSWGIDACSYYMVARNGIFGPGIPDYWLTIGDYCRYVYVALFLLGSLFITFIAGRSKRMVWTLWSIRTLAVAAAASSVYVASARVKEPAVFVEGAFYGCIVWPFFHLLIARLQVADLGRAVVECRALMIAFLANYGWRLMIFLTLVLCEAFSFFPPDRSTWENALIWALVTSEFVGLVLTFWSGTFYLRSWRQLAKLTSSSNTQPHNPSRPLPLT